MEPIGKTLSLVVPATSVLVSHGHPPLPWVGNRIAALTSPGSNTKVGSSATPFLWLRHMSTRARRHRSSVSRRQSLASLRRSSAGAPCHAGRPTRGATRRVRPPTAHGAPPTTGHLSSQCTYRMRCLPCASILSTTVASASCRCSSCGAPERRPRPWLLANGNYAMMTFARTRRCDYYEFTRRFSWNGV
jgi:hypothetical protein